MRQSHTTLPPQVAGPARGTLTLSLGAVQWTAAAPQHLRQHHGPLYARITWWGDQGAGDLVQLPPAAPAAAATAAAATSEHEGAPAEASLAFQLCTGPKYLTLYLRDMGCLALSIETGAEPAASSNGGGGSSHTAAAVATVSVGLLALDVQAPISGSHPLVLPQLPSSSAAGGAAAAAAGATIIGSLPVRLQLDYSGSSAGGALVSSFEMNEHLASSSDAAAAAAEAADVGTFSAADGQPAAGPVLGAPSLCLDLAAALQDRCADFAACLPACAFCLALHPHNMVSTRVCHVAVSQTTCRDRVASAVQQVASRQAGGAPGLGDQAAGEAALPLVPEHAGSAL